MQIENKELSLENNTFLQHKTHPNTNTTSFSNNKPKNPNHSETFRIIEPYRSLGLITNETTPVFFKRGIDRFLLTSNGNSFLLYNLEKLRLERISPPMASKITALAVYKNKIFTGINGAVQLWDKIHIISEYGNDISSANNNIKQIITFDDILIFTKDNGDLFIYSINSCELITKLNLNIEVFIHPTTYFNRILYTVLPEKYEIDLDFKSYKPNLILYNINSEKEIYNFQKDDVLPHDKIITITQSPVIDIIAITFRKGDIVLFNIKSSKIILTLHSQFQVDSISFSSNLDMSTSLLVTSSKQSPHITIWDLNKRSIHFTITNQFTFSIDNVMFLPNEPILIANSLNDNSIKMFKFDKSTCLPELLKQRSGHKSSPIKIRFYGENINSESKHLLTCDNLMLRNMSIINEHISKDFSYKKYFDKIFKNNSLNRQILSFDYNEFRERDWANIALVISDYEKPLLFSYENGSLSDNQPQLKNINHKCLCVCISMCGNFCFCGFDNGAIEKFNMQSGISRWLIENAHNGSVNDIKSDGINSMLISISHNEKVIKFWEIYQSKLIEECVLEDTPLHLEINKDNELIGVSLLNNKILLYDKSQIKQVRSFSIEASNKPGLIKDFVISSNAQWLLSVSDMYLKIHDILSTNLIEWVSFEKTPLSISISPNNQYIALSFNESKGIYLYINRTLFMDYEDIEEITHPIHCELSTFKVKKIKQRKDFDCSNQETIEIKGDNTNDKVNVIEIPEENKRLLSLSNENSMKYRLVNNIEIIQERNAPKVLNKEKVKAPFFLFNINDVLEGKPLPSKTKLNDDIQNTPEYIRILKNYSHFKNEKIVSKKPNTTEFVLTKLLKAFNEGKVMSNEITSFLNKLNPYIIDLEIRSLDPLLQSGGDVIDYLLLFVEYIYKELKCSNDNFEMIQAYLNRFVKVFSEEIMANQNIKNKLENINGLNEKKYEKVEKMYNNTMCLISYFGKIQM